MVICITDENSCNFWFLGSWGLKFWLPTIFGVLIPNLMSVFDIFCQKMVFWSRLFLQSVHCGVKRHGYEHYLDWVIVFCNFQDITKLNSHGWCMTITGLFSNLFLQGSWTLCPSSSWPITWPCWREMSLIKEAAGQLVIKTDFIGRQDNLSLQELDMWYNYV